MSDVTTPAALARRRTRMRWLLGALLCIACVAAGYALWRSQLVEVPVVATDGMERRVALEIERARSAVVEDPESAAAWGEVGLVLFANDLYPDAVPWLARAEQLDPHEPRWPYFRGLALRFDRPDEGLAALQRAAELAPKDSTIRLRLGEEFLKAGRDEQANAAFEEVLRLRPGDARALLGRGQILLARGKANTAIPLLQPATDDPTARKVARAGLAEAYERLGNDLAAQRERRLAAELPEDVKWPDPRIVALATYEVNLRGRLRNANALLDAGQLEDALALLRKAERDRPDSGEIHMAFAKAHTLVNELDRAEVELRRAVELEPNLAEAYFRLGGLLLIRKAAADAERCYRRVLELRPADGLAHLRLADCRLADGDRSGAIAALKDAVRFRPGLAAAHLKLGELLLDANKAEEALTSLEAAARLEPKNEKVQTLLTKAKSRKPK